MAAWRQLCCNRGVSAKAGAQLRGSSRRLARIGYRLAGNRQASNNLATFNGVAAAATGQLVANGGGSLKAGGWHLAKISWLSAAAAAALTGGLYGIYRQPLTAGYAAS